MFNHFVSKICSGKIRTTGQEQIVIGDLMPVLFADDFADSTPPASKRPKKDSCRQSKADKKKRSNTVYIDDKYTEPCINCVLHFELKPVLQCYIS